MVKLSSGLSLALLLAMGLGLYIGYTPLPLDILWGGLMGEAERGYQIVMQDIRLPRVLLGAVIGFSLGLSGAAMQGLLRNPLAEPGVVGVSATAGLGGVIAIYFGFASSFAWSLPLASMTGAGLAVGLIFMLTGRDASVLTIILAGVAISSLAVALTSLTMSLAPTPWAVTEMLFWVMGSLKDRSMTDVSLTFPFMFVGWILILSSARALDALTLGEETARSMGVNLKSVNLRLIIGTAMCVGASVSAAGSIGFIGLVVPHLLRPLVSYQPSKLLIVSGLGGAVLLILADIAVRLIPSKPEINLGVLTALIGAPFFLYLILKTRREMR